MIYLREWIMFCSARKQLQTENVLSPTADNAKRHIPSSTTLTTAATTTPTTISTAVSSPNDVTLLRKAAMMEEAKNFTRLKKAMELYKTSQNRVLSLEQILTASQRELKQQEDENKKLFGMLQERTQQQRRESLPNSKKQAALECDLKEAKEANKQLQKEQKDLRDQLNKAWAKGASREKELLTYISVLQADVASREKITASQEQELKKLKEDHEAFHKQLERSPTRKDVVKMKDSHLKSLLELIVAEQAHRREEKICVVCLETDAKVVFLPCKHQKVCEACAESMSLCPYCQQSVKKKIIPF